MASNSLEAGKQDESIPCIKSTESITLDLPPSCLEFYPSNPDFFVVGTYELEQSANKNQNEEEQASSPVQNRRGSLILFYLKGILILQQTLPVESGILDLHFKPSEPKVFAVATSKGAIYLYSLDVRRGRPLEFARSFQIFDPSHLTLSFAWCPIPDFHSTIAASCSNGEVTTLEYKPDVCWASSNVLKSHSLEAWTVTWSDKKGPTTNSVGTVYSELYSGGDDSVLSRHAITLGDTGGVARPNFGASVGDRKSHSAGITAILPLKVESGEEMVLTGSYDEFVRLLSPTQGRSKVLAEERLDGGVWRLKLLDPGKANDRKSPCFQVLASCMHAGARILEVLQTNENWHIKVVAKFMEHESMNYASDARIIMADGTIVGHTIVSTSFYDKRLCVWKFEDR